MTHQLKIWKYLRKVGRGTPQAVGIVFSMSPHTASKNLRRLVARGSATAIGTTRDRLYFATELRPVDRRGKHAEAKLNLAKGRVMGLQTIAANRGKIQLPEPVHALDAAMRKRRTSE